MNPRADRDYSQAAYISSMIGSESGAQSFKIKLSNIIQYSAIENHDDLLGEFRLTPTDDAFISNAQAFGFNYMGVDCAYVMTKVLGDKNHSLWLAVEIHQYKDSWGLDAGEISWLYLKNEVVDNKVVVQQLNLMPLNLFTDYESVEAVNALNSMGAPFEHELTFLESHSRIILQKFASANSMQWLRELATLGYTLSQFSQAKLQHPQTKIDIRHSLVPFILESNEENFKAMSYLVRLGEGGVHNTLWLTYFVDGNEKLNLDKFVISFGQYASDLTVCKIPSNSVVKSSYFSTQDDLNNGQVAAWLKKLGLGENEALNCIDVLNKTLNHFFKKEFIERLMLKNEYLEQPILIEELSILNSDELEMFLSANDGLKFKGNAPLYFSATSFTPSFYQPNKKYSLVEDYVQPITLAVTEEVVEEENEYDFKQPDFNEENKIEKLFSQQQAPKKPFVRRSLHGRHDRNAHFQPQYESVDEQIASAETKRSSKYDKKAPTIRQKHRFKGLVSQAKQSDIKEHITNVQTDLRETGEVASFLTQISQLPQNHEEIHKIDLEQLESNSGDIGQALAEVEKAAPKKRGRKPKTEQPVQEAAPVVETKVEEPVVAPVVEEAAVEEATPVVEPKKRGRKPKAVEAEKAIPKKRGRKPKTEQPVQEAAPVVETKVEEPVAAPVVEEAAVEEATPVVEPKKRGRKPKAAQPVQEAAPMVETKVEEPVVAPMVEEAAVEEAAPVVEPKKRGRKPKTEQPVQEATPVVETKVEEPVVAPVMEKAAVEEEVVVATAKKRGRPPKKKVEEAAVAVEATTVESKPEQVAEPVQAEPTPMLEAIEKADIEHETIRIGEFELSKGEQLKVLNTAYEVSSFYPINLIAEKPNFLLNSLIGQGMDKFEAVDALKALGCEFAEYGFHELQRRLAATSEIDLQRYVGLENYILECEFELQSRA